MQKRMQNEHVVRHSSHSASFVTLSLSVSVIQIRILSAQRSNVSSKFCIVELLEPSAQAHIRS
jgi:hypothetical protein